MQQILQHPEITCIERTGYPSWMNPEEDDFDQDAYEAYCDRCYEEYKERMLFDD
jgi:hypothetical protein